MDWIGFRSRRVWLGTDADPIHVGSGRLGIGSVCGRLGLGSGLPRGRDGLGPIADRDALGRIGFGSGRAWIGSSFSRVRFGSDQVWIQSTSGRVGCVLSRFAVGWGSARTCFCLDRCLSYARRSRTNCGSGRRETNRVGIKSVMDRIGLRPRRSWVGPGLDPTHIGSGRV
jgi:hypothetical protein